MANSARVAVGDAVVILGSDYVFGTAVISVIGSESGGKDIQACPHCKRVKISRRQRSVHRWLCRDCRKEFDEPLPSSVPVTKYRAVYGESWSPIDSPIRAGALRDSYAGGDIQNAIRRLDTLKVGALLAGLGVRLARPVPNPIPGGLVTRLVRGRIGQDRFRKSQLERFGEVCAITGPHPPAGLEAAHLYEFAKEPHHDVQGGLVLRRDLHAMFDRGLITIDPDQWTVEIDSSVRDAPQLKGLHGRPLKVAPELRPRREYVEAHRKRYVRA